MPQIFNTDDERNAYAAKCIQAGVDPERVAAELGYRHIPPQHQPRTLAEHNYAKHLAAELKAHHALRLRNKGWPDEDAARRCGYGSVRAMQKAIIFYIKKPRTRSNG